MPPHSPNEHAELLQGSLKDFLASKDGCFANTTRAFPKVLETFVILDETWTRALEDWGLGITPTLVLPLSLFFEAQLRVRLAFELGFSRCLPEAWAVLRAGIESLAYGCAFLQTPFVSDPPNDNEKAQLRNRRKLKSAFKKIKERGLFPEKYGLRQLRRYWARYSEFGSHGSLTSLATRLTRTESDGQIKVRFNFINTDKRTLHASLIDLLNCACLMESALSRSLESRLDLDPQFLKLHAGLQEKMRQANRELAVLGKLYLSR